MKKILFLLPLLAILSCGGDDDPQQDTRLLRQAIFDSASYHLQYDFNYDDARRISAIVMSGDDARTVTFAYDGNDRVTTATRSGGEILAFVYDNQDNLISYTMTEDNSNINYNPVTMEITRVPYYWELTSAGDLSEIQSEGYLYEDKSGPLSNVTGRNLHLIFYLTDPLLQLVFSKKAVTTFQTLDNGNPIFTETMENIFDESGRLVSAHFSGTYSFPADYTFTYGQP